MTELIQRKLSDSAVARWSVLGLVAFTMMCGYFITDMMAPLQDLLQHSVETGGLGWSANDYGTFTSAYGWFNVFFLMLIFGGMILDKMGVRFTGLMASALMIVGVAIKWYGVTHDFGGASINIIGKDWGYPLLVASFGYAIFGVGIEIAGITVSKIIVRWFKGKEMALAMGLEMATARIGTGLAIGVTPIISKAFGNSISMPVFIGLILLCIGFLSFLVFTVMDKNVIICDDLKSELQGFMQGLSYDKLFVLTDENTKRYCYPVVRDILGLGSDASLVTIQAGDTHKNLESLSQIWAFLSDNGATRHSVLLNIGGGMVTDIGGFAGATFKRGIRTVNVPTTLMASVDAAVGGKTGINFNGLKNEVGAFYQPLCVFIDCNFLKTLDRENILSGYAEMMKHALISSMERYASVFLYDIDTMNFGYLNRLVEQSVAVKEEIVLQDPKEQGIRKALNFGHTVGHAYESLSFKKQAPLLHGHAVAAGLVSELYLSYKLCGFPMGKLSQVVAYIKEYYSPFVFDCNDYETLYQLMTHDKKNEGNHINFTLLANIGDIRINQTVEKEKILESLDFYRESFGV